MTSTTQTQASIMAETRVFARRQLEHIRQVPEKLLDVTMQPVMFVLLFSFVFGGAIGVTGGNYREYLIGGILVQSLSFAMMGPATSIATDLGEGIIDRFRTLPIRRLSYLYGHFAAELMGLALAMTILLGTGLAVGWRSHGGVVGTVHALALLVAYGAAMIWAGLWVGMLVRSPDAVMGIGFTVMFPLTFLSNAFVPIESMPSALQWIAVYNPVSVLAAAARTLFRNPLTPLSRHSWPIDHPVPAAWISVAVIAVVVVPGAIRRFRVRTAH